jgi:hypothetical protein
LRCSAKNAKLVEFGGVHQFYDEAEEAHVRS